MKSSKEEMVTINLEKYEKLVEDLKVHKDLVKTLLKSEKVILMEMKPVDKDGVTPVPKFLGTNDRAVSIINKRFDVLRKEYDLLTTTFDKVITTPKEVNEPKEKSWWQKLQFWKN